MSDPIFYVKALADTDGTTTGYVAATYLKNNGTYVVDPIPGGSQQYATYSDSSGDNQQTGSVSNPNNYIVVPATLQTQIGSFASQIQSTISQSYLADPTGATGFSTALGMMTGAFMLGGSQDLQRSTLYGVPAASHVPAFIDGASYYLGYTTAGGGLPLDAAQLGGGIHNQIVSLLDQLSGLSSLDTQGDYGLSKQDEANINLGFANANLQSQQTSSIVNTTSIDSSGDLTEVAIISSQTLGASGPTTQFFSQAGTSNVLGTDVQIDLKPGTSPTTTITTTDASGTSQTLDFSSLANVANAFNPANSAAISGGGLNIAVGGDQAHLNATGNGQDIFFLIGNGGSGSIASGGLIITLGNSNTMDFGGSAWTADNDCWLSDIIGSGGTVANSDSSSATVSGNSNDIAAGNSGTIDATGRRSVMSYLLSPLQRYVHDGERER
ncbi:hypothetical protein [Rhodopila sp.]|uniref:hypothetical protein n=1 Tax=Rhodopila sp. TaxID=2480087 RepID=UPI002C809A82|nr:hypothetical protein [Rhodopila sp.]HVZ08372.1 hypothetical protein [Rhodopila sp.]